MAVVIKLNDKVVEVTTDPARAAQVVRGLLVAAAGGDGDLVVEVRSPSEEEKGKWPLNRRQTK